MASLFKSIFRFYFEKTGWKVEGEIPVGVRKAIIIGGAHTSNWDLIYALGSLFTKNLKIKFIIKKEALIFPLKNFLLSLGAIPVDRSHSAATNYVDQLAEVFKKSDECFLAIAPEGTRKAVKKWKSGYYHIAKKANVPIIVCYLDYENKIGHFGKVIDPNKYSEEESMVQMKEYLKKARPKVPENFTL